MYKAEKTWLTEWLYSDGSLKPELGRIFQQVDLIGYPYINKDKKAFLMGEDGTEYQNINDCIGNYLYFRYLTNTPSHTYTEKKTVSVALRMVMVLPEALNASEIAVLLVDWLDRESLFVKGGKVANWSAIKTNRQEIFIEETAHDNEVLKKQIGLASVDFRLMLTKPSECDFANATVQTNA